MQILYQSPYIFLIKTILIQQRHLQLGMLNLKQKRLLSVIRTLILKVLCLLRQLIIPQLHLVLLMLFRLLIVNRLYLSYKLIHSLIIISFSINHLSLLLFQLLPKYIIQPSSFYLVLFTLIRRLITNLQQRIITLLLKLINYFIAIQLKLIEYSELNLQLIA